MSSVSVASQSSCFFICSRRDLTPVAKVSFYLFLDRIATEDKFSSTPLQVQEVNEKKSVVNDKLDQEDG